MRDIESVSLTYTNEYRMEYQYYAEFFRFLGIYVYENLKSGVDRSNEIDIEFYNFSFCYEITEHIDFKSENEKSESLKRVVADAFDVVPLEQWMEDLIIIYNKCNLLRASATLQYFRVVKGEKLVLRAGSFFENGADCLLELIQEKPEYLDNHHIRYAKLYCKQKANMAQFHYDNSYRYYVNYLAIEGKEILKDFPNFSNIWVLLGMIYENSTDYLIEAIDAYQRSIDIIKDQPYVVSVYYWLGRMCEENSTLRQLSNESYKKAYNLVKRYRNIYKVANIYICEQYYTTALEIYEECLCKIEEKGNYLDPLEQEYYFKVCVQMSSIYVKLGEYTSSMEKAAQAIEFRQNIQSGRETANEYTKFYYEIYEDDKAKEYIDLEICRMNPKKAYENLATACQAGGLAEDANRYWEKYREYA